jgi:uncharacterized protein YndB with AHSA1/START domain
MDPMDREALTAPPPGSILVVERQFDAPRQRVWAAWTTPDLVGRWWGPKGFTAPAVRISLRVGGSYFLCLRAPDGQDTCTLGFFHEIVPFERLVMTQHFADQKGNVVPAAHYGLSPDFPVEMLLTVTFEETAGRTKVTIRHAGLPAGKETEGARRGWEASLDRLAAVVGSGPSKP